MEGVTTAIVLFIFVCVLFPRLIDNRAQYYIAFVCTLLIILLHALAVIFEGSVATRMFFLTAVALLQIVAIALLFLSAGGLTVRGLSKDMAGAFEVIRRGETEKEIIIPIGDQKEKKDRKRAVDTPGEPPERFDISSEVGPEAGYPPKTGGAPGATGAGTAPRRDTRPDGGPIPMD
jgi:hypothetical protein